MEKILVINFGSRFVHKEVVKCLKIRGIEYNLIPWENTWEELNKNKYCGMILSGSPWSVYEANSPKIDRKCLEFNMPVLGICYGLQLISFIYGGKVGKAEKEEQKTTEITFKKSILFDGLEGKNLVEMRHSDRVYELPKGFVCTAETNDCKISAIENVEKNIYAVQFHPELGGCGDKVLDNFFYKICNLKNK